ncbi:MAG: sigma-54 dependent transcriptional regulator [Desulfomicrobium sp.]|nr:sigma-54 dependent transcriptional regulator [Desulfomicrobium sp.]
MIDGQKNVLIVDADPVQRRALADLLASDGHAVMLASDGEEALLKLENGLVDLVFAEEILSDMSGQELLWECIRRWQGLPFIMLTGSGSVPRAVAAIKDGAFDYLVRPIDGQELLRGISRIFAASAGRTWARSGNLLTEELWGGKSPSMQRLYKLIERVAPTEATILLLGESGTGKEKIAGLLHRLSQRSRGPLVIVDCGSTPSTLLESELFGHAKGSFTNAFKDKKGLVAEAHGGTLFLDEIGNISSEMQLRLLRFLQERKIRRVGDLVETAVNCRVIAATNADLAELVRSGEFREDLYYRLKVITIQVPPLRERKADIPILADRFLRLFAEDNPLSRLDAEVEEAILDYPWPGNVRELRNMLEAAVILSSGDVIRMEDMQFEDTDEDSPLPGNLLSLAGSEKQVVLNALERSSWVVKDAADLLGVSRRTMHYKIKKFRIDTAKRST